MFDTKDSATDGTCILIQRGILNQKAACSQWQRAPVDDCAHTGQQIVADACHAATQYDRGGVKHMHDHCDDLANFRCSFPHQSDRVTVACTYEPHQIVDSVRARVG